MALRYPVQNWELTFGELSLRLSGAANFDALLDELIDLGPDHEAFIDERIPYWADLWPSALGLAKYLAQADLIRPGMPVLELGCGLGLPGVVAGMLGAEVALTDYLEDALAFARHNWMQNLPDRQPRTVQMDWRLPDPALAAELVLASDIAYEQRFFADLPQAFQTLTWPGGMILVSEPNRESSQPFFAELPRNGFQVEKEVVQVAWNGQEHQINVFKMLFPG